MQAARSVCPKLDGQFDVRGARGAGDYIHRARPIPALGSKCRPHHLEMTDQIVTRQNNQVMIGQEIKRGWIIRPREQHQAAVFRAAAPGPADSGQIGTAGRAKVHAETGAGPVQVIQRWRDSGCSRETLFLQVRGDGGGHLFNAGKLGHGAGYFFQALAKSRDQIRVRQRGQ